MMFNGDGRLLDYQSSSIDGYVAGRGYSWSNDALYRYGTLPWERRFDGSYDTTNNQVRGPKISMMLPYHSKGLFAIANNNRLIYMGNTMNELWPSNSNGGAPVFMGVMNG